MYDAANALYYAILRANCQHIHLRVSLVDERGAWLRCVECNLVAWGRRLGMETYRSQDADSAYDAPPGWRRRQGLDNRRKLW